uniref:C-type lectin domain-containing protein n=1 Tax=Echeneis naucrates TaxID=173247 RepID=A0A665WGK6_ECHNA
MQQTEAQNQKSDVPFNTLICQEDLCDEEHHPDNSSQKKRQQVSMSSMIPGRRGRPAVVILLVLAAVLLIVDVALGLHYNHLTAEDAELIKSELNILQDTYKIGIEATYNANKNLESEKSRQTETNWELEHQTRRKSNYEERISKIQKDIAALKSHLPFIRDSCERCPPGWVFLNLMCYYFPFTAIAGQKSWQNAREYCQAHGGDLMVIDSKDKENTTVTFLRNKIDRSKPLIGFWIGLTDLQEEGTWKWLDGTLLVEGYWNYDELGDDTKKNCAAVFPKENIFQAWDDAACDTTMKWICEKSPTL